MWCVVWCKSLDFAEDQVSTTCHVKSLGINLVILPCQEEIEGREGIQIPTATVCFPAMTLL